MNALNPYESPKSEREGGRFEIDWRGIGQALLILALAGLILAPVIFVALE